MKATSLFGASWLAVLMVVTNTTATAQENDDTAARVQQLETQLGTLNSQIQDLKAQVQSSARAPQDAKPNQSVNVRFGDRIVFEDPRGDWSVFLSGRVQLDYRQFNAEGAIANTFSQRRVRLGAGAQVFKNYAIYVEGDFASGDATGTTQQSSRATVTYLDLGFWDAARIRLGQFKPQIGLEQTLLDLQSDFMERGLQQNILDGNGLNYDRGIMLFGAPRPGLWYAASVTNGTGINLEERQSNTQDVQAQGKDLTLRTVVDLARMLEVDRSILHLGLGYKNGIAANSTASPYSAPGARTEARGITFFNPQPFNATGRDETNIERTLWAFESLLAFGPVKLQGEYWKAEYTGTRNLPVPVTAFSPKIKGGYLAAMWLLTGEDYVENYRDSIPQKSKPKNRLALGPDGGWGAWELGLRYSFFDASGFNSAAAAGTGQIGASATGVTPVVSVSTNKAKAYTAQVKWIHNVFARMMLDYVDTRFDTPVTANGVTLAREKAAMLRYQVDF